MDLNYSKFIWVFLFLVQLSVAFAEYDDSYVITTSREWFVGEDNSVCVVLTSAATAKDVLEIGIIRIDPEGEVIMPFRNFPLTKGEVNVCNNFYLTSLVSEQAHLRINGQLGNKNVNYTQSVSIKPQVVNAIMETDKYQYKQSEFVQLRILTVEGVHLRPSALQFEKIWVKSPSSKAVAQWVNVSSENGFIHKSFQLSPNAEVGNYQIVASRPYHISKEIPTNYQLQVKSANFEVKEAELPPFKLSIKSPDYISTPDKKFNMEIEICAETVHGEPVTGYLSYSFHTWAEYYRTKRSMRYNPEFFSQKVLTVNNNITTIGCVKVKSQSFKFQGKYNPVSINAELEDAISGVTVKAQEKKAIVISEEVYFENISPRRISNPGLPFFAKVLAKYGDGNPVADKPMTVCTLATCKEITTNEQGVLIFIVPPHSSRRITVFPFVSSSLSPNFNSPYQYPFKIETFQSPSNSSITLDVDQSPIDCVDGTESIEFDIPIYYSVQNEYNATLNFQILSRGLIIYSKSVFATLEKGNLVSVDEELLLEDFVSEEERNSYEGRFVIPVSLPNIASPKVKVFVWYTREDGEVVADSQTVNIVKCLPHKVKIELSSSSMDSMSIEAEPLSTCSIGIIDKRQYALKQFHYPQLIDSLLDKVSRPTIYKTSRIDVDYCKELLKSDKDDEDDYIFRTSDFRNPSYESNMDAFKALHAFGLTAQSNLNLNYRQCEKITNFWGTQNTVDFLPTVKNFDEESRIHTNDESTVLWNTVNIDEDGHYLHLFLPIDGDTDGGEKVGVAVCTHPVKGVGISDAIDINTSEDIKIVVTAPDNVKAGEAFELKYWLKSYTNKAVKIKLQFEHTPESIFQEISTTEICVDANEKYLKSEFMTPKEVGPFQILLNTFVSVGDAPTCNQSTQMQESRPRQFTKIVNVEIDGRTEEYTRTISVYPRDYMPWFMSLNLPSNVIPGSSKLDFQVTGQPMGLTLENLNQLTNLKVRGGGEQNLLNFAPNLFALEFASKYNLTEVKETALRNLNWGYLEQLKYRHTDGSYSVFGDKDTSGSTWLTASVLKYLAKASEYIYVDQKYLNSARLWLKEKQGEDGCLVSAGKLLHEEITAEKSFSGKTRSLTAHTLISLIEAGEDKSSDIIQKGFGCLSNTTEPWSWFSMSLLGYAMTVAELPEAFDVIKMLTDPRFRGKSKKKYQLDSSNLRHDGEIFVTSASYAALSMLKLRKKYPNENFLRDTEKAVNMLNMQRNFYGGFSFAQDTIIALEALTEYEKLNQPKENEYVKNWRESQGKGNHVKLTVSNLRYNVDIKEENRWKPISIPTNIIPSNYVFLYARLKNGILVQGRVQYKLEISDTGDAFRITVDSVTNTETGCKTRNIGINISYLLNGQSSMGIIEVNLPSGYRPHISNLEDLISGGKIKKYQIDYNQVNLYVEEFQRNDTRFSFNVYQKHVVKKVPNCKLDYQLNHIEKGLTVLNGTVSVHCEEFDEATFQDVTSGYVRVYDYYKPEHFAIKKYELKLDRCVSNSSINFPDELFFEDEPLINLRK